MRRRQILAARAKETALAARPQIAMSSGEVSLKALRTAKGLSYEEVAEMAGLTPAYVRTLEGMEKARGKIVKALK